VSRKGKRKVKRVMVMDNHKRSKFKGERKGQKRGGFCKKAKLHHSCKKAVESMRGEYGDAARDEGDWSPDHRGEFERGGKKWENWTGVSQNQVNCMLTRNREGLAM